MTKIAIIGGGAAGMYASVFLAERDTKYMYLKRMKNLEKNYLLRERVGAM